ncbi:MAG: hypothetical protein Q8O20_04410 [Sulfuricurvum sp.]|uniref:hypothetical protein n=1 Tax=Sulfuricurvum sp. TaxID=2025608 RepID=UPI00273644A0|nr:hypothetical protein [Sulfuricurvum sp.]MDP2850295.1 hypothetical protein [Sulfuricurvum sp.]
MNRKDLLQRLEELFKARSRTLAEILQQISELNKKDDENGGNGSSDSLGSATMNMKILELQFIASIQYFQDLEDPDKEAVEILNQLAKVVDLLEEDNDLEAYHLIHKAVDQASIYKLNHTGEEFELDHKKMMGIIKEFVVDSGNGKSSKNLMEALAELKKKHPKKSSDFKL